MDKPDYVVNFKKPKGTEIKHIGNNWYLYERFDKYDPAIKRSRKISGKCLGKITEEGFVESTKRMVTVSKDEVSQEKKIVSSSVEVAASIFFWERTSKIREQLRKYFPDNWQQIYVTALLRVIYRPYFKRLESNFEGSFLSYMFPGVEYSSYSNTEFFDELGSLRAIISRYMKEDLNNESSYILIDGYRLITSSKYLSLAETGYDAKRVYKPDTNILYAFSIGEKGIGFPSYYKQFPDGTLDMEAFKTFIEESGISSDRFTIITDKGKEFSSEEDLALLEELNLNYIIPLRRGNVAVKDKVPSGYEGYDDMFIFSKKVIQYKVISRDDVTIILYRDGSLYNDETCDFIDRFSMEQDKIKVKIEKEEKLREDNKGNLTDEELSHLKGKIMKNIEALNKYKEVGTFTLKTNLKNVHPVEVYKIYKQRQKIERFFKMYDSTIDLDALYMRNDMRYETWLFLNHISASIAINLLNEISELKLVTKISLEDVRSVLSKIHGCRVNNKWHMPHIKKSHQVILDQLNFKIDENKLNKVLAECEKLI